MNRDTQSLLVSTFTLILGALAMVLTTSWVWPSVILTLGGIGFILALSTPARESRPAPPAGPTGDERMYWQGN
ncbi:MULTISPECIES: hypothetical protein [unclassified Nocardia]|uniref:hypothetical protein n=1 Tax=unclassified Nocardia TaxID=2637762 RepID=UPI0035D63759